MLCVDNLCKGIKTRKICLPHAHISKSEMGGSGGWGWGDFWCEASVAVLNPKYLGNNLTYSVYLKYDLSHLAISNQGLEDVFFGGWPLNKLWGFSLLYPGEKSQAIEAGEESSQNIRSHLIQGLGETALKTQFQSWWLGSGEGMMEKDCQCWLKTHFTP